MNKMISKKWALASIPLFTIVTILILSQAQPAYAVTTNCIGTLDPGTYDDVIVPTDTFCTILDGVTINGDVTILAGGSLMGTAGGTIRGDVSSTVFDCTTVFLVGFTIDGTITITGCLHVVILNSVIGGKIDLEQTQEIAIIAGSTVGFLGTQGHDHIDLKFGSGSTYQVFNNVVKDKIQVEDNVVDQSSPFPTFVAGNTAEKIECLRNFPDPVLGSLPSNTADLKQGECSTL